jgi:hypothetical protein
MAVPNSRDTFKEYILRKLGKPNKYMNWYFNIIDRAVFRNWNKKTAPCYTEKHHIIPISLGGINSDVVCLTAREHYICHLLLTKFTQNKDKMKMCLALNRLVHGNEKNYQISSITYGYLKEVNAIACSERTTEYWEKIPKKQRSELRSGEKNSRWGSVVRGTETAQKISKANKGKLSGEKHPLFGKKHNKNSIEKISLNRKGKAVGEKNAMYGKIGKASGKKWYNDGMIEKYFYEGSQPANWVSGRLRKVS